MYVWYRDKQCHILAGNQGAGDILMYLHRRRIPILDILTHGANNSPLSSPIRVTSHRFIYSFYSAIISLHDNIAFTPLDSEQAFDSVDVKTGPVLTRDLMIRIVIRVHFHLRSS